MLKNVLNMLMGMIICAAISTAFAVVGTPPIAGPALQDGVWLQGLAGAQNFTFQSGIVAHAGGTQAACLNLPIGIAFIQVDTVASSGDSVCLPFAVAGANIQIRNNSATTLNIFGQAANNPLTGAADTINGTAGSTNYSPTTQQSADCFVAKNGAWSCVKGS